MKDFWLSCGYHLLDRDEGGGLVVTDEFLKVYLARSELTPPPDACIAERTIYAVLMDEPRRPISASEIAAIADADARENWQVMIDFRDHLLRHKTLEAAYAEFARRGAGQTPSLFINQLVHVILRNALDGCDDAQMVRAAELLFRVQRVTTFEQSLIAADDEIIGSASAEPSSPLVSMLGIPDQSQIDVLTEDNAESYWERSDRFDMAFNLTAGQAGLSALARVIERWVRHAAGVEADVEALPELRDVNLSWYVGLDSDATKIGDAIWNGEQPSDEALGRIIGLFRLTFRDPAIMLEKIKGEPVYLILAMTGDKMIRMKPQNLVVGLPLRHLEAAL